MIGKTLSHFRITAKLGEGGMGEVYRAEDAKLGREVAIKVLPEAFTEDPERFARFEREAHVLASLNHPNIAAIHDLAEDQGVHFLVLELVEGEDLAVRLSRGPVAIEAALPLALQIAEALEAAHAKGIVHRDLKSANVMVDPDDQVKILDFGLAKAAGPTTEVSGLTNSPTLTAQMTQAGVILGTAAYMSPEQARAEEADHRADIWSFGVVLFELLTGARPFPGTNLTDQLAEIVKGEPSWEALPPETPAGLVRLVRRCLVKERRHRLQAIGDARIEIQIALAGGEIDTAIHPGGLELNRRLRAQSLIPIAIGAATVTALAIWWFAGQPRESSLPVRQTLVATPNLTRIQNPVLSPDASRIAFVGEGRLYVHDLTNMDSRELADTAGATNPFWSPDSQWVGYFDRTRMFKISVNGGVPVPIATLPAECPLDICGGSWTNEGRILVGTGEASIVSVREGGGDWSSYLEPDENEHFHSVTALPGGQGALFYVDPDEDDGRFDLLIDGERVRGPAAAGFSPLAYSTDGYLLFEGPVRKGVWAVPFEPTNVGPFGEPFLLFPGAHYPSLGRDATLLVVRPPERIHQLVWVDRQGVVREVVDEARPLAIEPRLSPDGSRIALTSTDGDGSSVLVLEPAKGARRWLARSSRPVNFSNSPAWTADGERLLSVEPGSTGSDTEETMIRIQTLGEPNSEALIRGFDPEESGDGHYLVYSAGTFIERDILYLDHRDPLPEPRVFLEEPGIQGMHELSPDSRYIAFLHSDTGMTGLEVYLSPFPEGGSRLQISNGGVTVATQIRWRSDGERLYYLRASDGMLMEVELDLAGEPELSPPRELFTDKAANLNLMGGFDVARDGERFLVTKATVPPGGDRGGIVLIQNWLDLLPSRP